MRCHIAPKTSQTKQQEGHRTHGDKLKVPRYFIIVLQSQAHDGAAVAVVQQYKFLSELCSFCM